MRRAHFEALQPRCVLCHSRVAVATILRGDGDDVTEGIVSCTNDGCRREYPVIDGIPIFVGAIRAWLTANPLAVLTRTDLSPEMESLLGDALGPGSPFDTNRQHAGMYADDHYAGDGSAKLLDRALALAGEVGGPLLDLGCAAGGTTLRLAETTNALTLGADLNFAMLRVASQALREGRVHYARRRVGVVYDRREVAVSVARPDLVDFWCCDAAALPFADGTFGTVTSLNVVDIVRSPQDAVAETARVLRSGGNALIATPYDWTPSATPVEQWLGGHSQRSAERGASEPPLRALLAERFAVTAEDERVPWRVRLHERSTMEYSVHVIAARRRDN